MACLETYLQLIVRSGKVFEPPMYFRSHPLEVPQTQTLHREMARGKKSISARDAREYKPQAIEEALREHLVAALSNKIGKSGT